MALRRIITGAAALAGASSLALAGSVLYAADRVQRRAAGDVDEFLS